MTDCLFCSIARGEIPCDKVFEDEHLLAFRDIHPQAQAHLLIIPKEHFSGMNELDAAPDTLLADILRTAKAVAEKEGIMKSGYRLVSNCGPDACQSVPHLHFHILGGQQLNARMS